MPLYTKEKIYKSYELFVDRKKIPSYHKKGSLHSTKRDQCLRGGLN